MPRFKIDVAIHLVDGLARDGEAKAGARFFRTEVWKEDTFGNFGVNTLAVVLKIDADFVFRDAHRYTYTRMLSGISRLESVEDKV